MRRTDLVTVTDEQRQDYNARRRDKRRTNSRQIRARHSTRTLLMRDSSYNGDQLAIGAEDVIRHTNAMYGSYLDEPLATEEAATALEAVLAS
jgi:hypothetical protein